VLLAVTGAHRIGRQLCGPLIARFSALIGLWLPTLTTLLGPVHAAFIYNAPLFYGGPAREPSSSSKKKE
jgi:hypothetical protein